MQYPDAIRESAVKGLMRGVAAHHAGCLPLWKSFIEELFQRGLVKVVFATETLAAGINMPARTAVISSLSKRIDAGRQLLTPNELFQMAGRAGRRGIDTVGHAVLVQTSYEGPEECCDIIFAGLEPLVSQFTASYGMVLNLLAVCIYIFFLFLSIHMFLLSPGPNLMDWNMFSRVQKLHINRKNRMMLRTSILEEP